MTLVSVFAMLEIRGICRAFPRPPFLSFPPEVVEAMRRKLVGLRVISRLR